METDASFHAELTLPAEPRSLPIARACAAELIALSSFEPAEAERLLEAAVEACANVIDHAYEPGEKGTFTLTGELTGRYARLAVRDQGVPFDPDDMDPEADERPARISRSGGLQLIRDAVDHAVWINHGRRGKEIRLEKSLPDVDITGQLSAEELQPIPEDAEQAPEQEYVIRRFRSEDAIGVSRCIYRVYGYTYLHEDCYYPERLVRLNDTGELISVVAVTQSGEVVGHYALERWNMTLVPERGMAVVAPAHRGRDLMGRMRVVLEEEGRKAGLIGSFSHAVTRHVLSQRVNEEFGAVVCGIALGSIPGGVEFKKLHTPGKEERVSGVIYYAHLQPPAPRAVYLPRHHRDLLTRMYDSLHVPVEATAGTAPSGDAELDVDYSPGLKSGVIRVRRVGGDSLRRILQARRRLGEQAGAEVINLEIPLAQSGAPALTEAAEAEGFFFSGLGPHFATDGDALLLQALNVPLDTGKIKIASPFAREILDYIVAEKQRLGA